jgi:hypothetical protein
MVAIGSSTPSHHVREVPGAQRGKNRCLDGLAVQIVLREEADSRLLPAVAHQVTDDRAALLHVACPDVENLGRSMPSAAARSR